MKYTVATIEPMILSSSAYFAMQMGYRLERTPKHVFGTNLSKEEAILLFDSIKINDAPGKQILDENNLCVNTCYIKDNYKTNICENHKGKA